MLVARTRTTRFQISRLKDDSSLMHRASHERKRRSASSIHMPSEYCTTWMGTFIAGLQGKWCRKPTTHSDRRIRAPSLAQSLPLHHLLVPLLRFPSHPEGLGRHSRLKTGNGSVGEIPTRRTTFVVDTHRRKVEAMDIASRHHQIVLSVYKLFQRRPATPLLLLIILLKWIW